MKKLYNTPELDIAMLNKLDTMTASGITEKDTDDNVDTQIYSILNPGLTS